MRRQNGVPCDGAIRRARYYKEPGGALSSIVLYPCTIPVTAGGVAQMGNRELRQINGNYQPPYI